MTDEQISAWLDGELNQSDAATVQAAIDSDSDVARRASELRVLAGVIQSLPVESVPNGFHELVIKATQGVVRDPATTIKPAKATSSGRGWWIPAALVAAAAMVMVTLNVNEIQPSGIADSAQLVAESSGRFDATVSQTTSATPNAESSSGSMMVADSMTAESAGGFSGAAKRVAARTLDPDQLEYTTSLTDVSVGDVVEAIDQSDDQLSVVKLTVVDRNASMGRFRVLLAVHGGTTSARGGMVMVEGTTVAQLAACFKKLQEEKLCETILVASNTVDYQDVSGAPEKLKASVPVPMGMTRASDASAADRSGAGFGDGAKSRRSEQPAESIASSIPQVTLKSNSSARVAVDDESEDVENSVKPVRLLIVLEPSDVESREGSGSIIDFRAVYGRMG